MRINEVTNCKYGEYYCSTDKKVKCRKSPKKSRTVSEDGKIVPGVNTTQDVKPGETQRQAAKFGNKVDKDGRPPELHARARKNSDPNTLYNMGLSEAKMSRHEMGFGLSQYSNDNFALVGGARSGNSDPGEVRLRFDIYSWELADKLGDPNKAKIGFTELRVSEEDGEILGLINIELESEHRNKGYGRRIVQDIVDTTKKGGLDIHDIQDSARKFWDSLGIKYKNKTTGRVGEGKDDGSKMNPVAKNLNKFNKPATFKDRKKSLKRGDAPKHKGKGYEN